MDYEVLIEQILTLDDATCADYFRHARYGPSMQPSACPKCATSRFGRIKGRVRVDGCKGCSAQLSVTAGTALHGLQHPLCYVLAAAVLITRPGSISSRQLAKILEIGWESARRLGHRVREALAQDLPVLEPEKTNAVRLSVVVRRDPGEYPRSRWHGRIMPPTLYAVALADSASGAAVIEVCGHERSLTLKRLVEAHLEDVEEIEWDKASANANWTMRSAKIALAATHQRVSRRWLQLYISALGWCAGEETTRGWRALEATLAAPRRTWVQLRPARYQDEPGHYFRFRYPKPQTASANP